jgi:hypothetical protein
VPGERRIGAHTDSSFMTFLPQVCMRARPASIVALFCLNVCAQAVLCW